MTSSQKVESRDSITLPGTNISYLGKRKIIFKYALSGGYVNSLEGILNPLFFRRVISVQGSACAHHGYLHDLSRIISNLTVLTLSMLNNNKIPEKLPQPNRRGVFFCVPKLHN